VLTKGIGVKIGIGGDRTAAEHDDNGNLEGEDKITAEDFDGDGEDVGVMTASLKFSVATAVSRNEWMRRKVQGNLTW
jgi:hypothetical protein